MTVDQLGTVSGIENLLLPLLALGASDQNLYTELVFKLLYRLHSKTSSFSICLNQNLSVLILNVQRGRILNSSKSSA